MRRDSRLVLGHLQEIVGIKVYDSCRTLSSILHQILSKVIKFLDENFLFPYLCFPSLYYHVNGKVKRWQIQTYQATVS